MKRPARRVILKVIFLLIAGAAVNVAVAWGLAFLDPYGGKATTVMNVIDRSNNPWLVVLTKRQGAVRLSSMPHEIRPASPTGSEDNLLFNALTADQAKQAFPEDILDRIPAWSRVHGHRGTWAEYVANSLPAYDREDARGWPLVCLRSAFDPMSFDLKKRMRGKPLPSGSIITDTSATFPPQTSGAKPVTYSMAPGNCVLGGHSRAASITI